MHRQPGCWLRSSHTLKECVIAHWSSDPAPKIQRGSNHIPKLGNYSNIVGRRAFCTGRNQSGSAGGQYRSENAGISSEKFVRIKLAESLRFLEEGSSAPSKSGAKVRPKGVADAHTVDIP